MSNTYLNSGTTYTVAVGAGGSSCGGSSGAVTGGPGWYTVGGAGSVLTTGGGATGGMGYTYLTYPGYTLNDDLKTASLSVEGKADFKDDVLIKGKSVTDRLDEIERRLCILQRDPGLEERWSELKALGEQYRELEKDIIEKEKIWDILKK